MLNISIRKENPDLDWLLKKEEMKMKAIFIDRDGTLNIDKGYIHKIEDFKLQPFVREGLKLLQDDGYKLFIISNQSGINRGIFTQQEMALFNAELLGHLPGIRIAKLYFCPHTPDENCPCRKPKTYNLEKAIKEYHLDRKSSWVIGDQTTDIKMANDAGLKSVLVATRYQGPDKFYKATPTYKAENILEAAELIVHGKIIPKKGLKRWMH